MFISKDNTRWIESYLEHLKRMDKNKGRCRHCKYRRRCM